MFAMTVSNIQLNNIDYRTHVDFEDVIRESYGKWSHNAEPNRRFVDHRHTTIISRRRRDLQKAPLQASVVILNNSTFDHLTDYK